MMYICDSRCCKRVYRNLEKVGDKHNTKLGKRKRNKNKYNK